MKEADQMEAMKILLVDDRSENLLALESLLKSPDIAFYKATSGTEALEHLLVHDFALAILDVQMPEMDGFELAELMRGMEQTRSVPIIFVTAGVIDRISSFRGYERGAVDFLFKPLEPNVVRSKVQVFMELARQRQLLRQQLEQTQRALRERDQALGEAREALRTRDEFMSIASHELKTPLTSLHLNLQLMRRNISRVSSDPEALKRLDKGLEVSERQSGKLAALLDELLDLTRVRLGKLRLLPETVSLTNIAREVVDRFKTEAEQKGCPIRFESNEEISGVWDPMRIEQIVTNLVSNAIKYGDGKPIEVRVERNRDGELARVLVTDQGMGIPDEMQKKIFERFERAVSDGNIAGLGLGLYITRQIVEAHGGSIQVRSRVSEGSTFIIELPLSAESVATSQPLQRKA